jgi:TonB family protein
MRSLGLSHAPTNGKSYLWSFPGCPVNIHLGLDLIERIRTEVLELAPEDREVGGLLLGHASPESPDVHVSDYFLVPARAGATQYLVDSLAHALQSCSASQRKVVGNFRTHLGPRIQLRPEDLACIRQSFRDPKNVFLVIRPHDGRASAGFFFWQDGSVFGDSTLTFPFSARELSKPGWDTLVGGSPAPGRWSGAVARAKESMSQAWARVGLALFAVALLFAIMLLAERGLFQNDRSAGDVSGSLGLRARREGLSVIVSWDASNPRLAGAKQADLLIWDGPGQPVFLSLNPAQLHSGRTVLTSVSDKVDIRMDVIAQSGAAKIESVSLFPDKPPPPATAAKASPESPIAKAKTLAQARPPAPKKSKLLEDLSEPRPSRPARSQASAPPPLHVLDKAPDNAPDNAPDSPMQAAEAISATQPVLPPDLKALISSDNVIGVQIEINTDGKVVSAKLASEKGPAAESLARLAVAAAWRWRFRPAMQNGRPVHSEKTIEFLFRPSN